MKEFSRNFRGSRHTGAVEFFLILIAIGLVLVWFVFPIWAILRLRRLQQTVDLMSVEMDHLRRLSAVPPSPRPDTPASPVTPSVVLPPPVPVPSPTPAVLADLLSPPPPTAPAVPASPPVAASSSVPNIPERVEPSSVAYSRPIVASSPPWWQKIDWEQFMGVKLIAWLGGLAAFLGVAFAVKYSFEHELIPREVRAASGFLLAAGFLIAGLRLRTTRYAVTAHTLCATGVVSLYAVTFACRAFYQFPFFSPGLTFALMALVTGVAFLLAVRLEARVVAVLGLVGGFLTPVLISTGQDNPLGLFSYIGLLNAGVLAVAWHRRWSFLPWLGMVGTLAVEIGWAQRFLHSNPPHVTLWICAVMFALHLAAAIVAERTERIQKTMTQVSLALALSALAFGWYLAQETPAGLAPLGWLTYLLAIDVGVLALAWFSPRAVRFVWVVGGLVFAILGHWMASRVGQPQLPAALVAILVFAALHSGTPLALWRRHGLVATAGISQYVPVVGLGLVLWGLLQRDLLSPWVWPVILLLDVIALVIAWLTWTVLGVVLVVVLTLLAMTQWLNHAPSDSLGLGTLLALAGGFAVLFSVVGVRLRRTGGETSPRADGASAPPWLSDLLPVLGAVLPYLLLVMVVQRLSLPAPHAVFGLALALTLLTLWVARALRSAWVPLCAVAGASGFSYAWVQAQSALTAQPLAAAVWMLALLLLLTVAPFVRGSGAERQRLPWLASALGSVALFTPLYQLLRARQLWPEEIAGALPLCVATVPLVGLLRVLRRPVGDAAVALAQVAAMGGAVLFFVTVAVPLQLSREWITLAWALEGAALLWLYHRVPHRGLGWTGLALLLVSFARLALNPSILAYHTTGYAPIFNWYLYTYGGVAAALFAGAALLAPPRDVWWLSGWPAKLQAAGVVLLFLLLNLEIADFFAEPGQLALTFDFSGNLARDMSYTVGWALFALGLLIAGVWRRQRFARYAALGLLAVTLLKLFLHDLSHLGALYRIGALFAVAIIAIASSLIYQRFVPLDEKTAPPRS